MQRPNPPGKISEKETKKAAAHSRREPWTADELKIFRDLRSSHEIQAFLDSLPYSEDPVYRSPRSVLRDRKAHCFDGALLAAAALGRLGHRTLVVDMLAENDDDHMLAIFRRDGYLGAVAKSNFVGLRYREPIFRNLRELVLSYFEDYYNLDGDKTLRGYTAPLDLARFEHLDWKTRDDNLEEVAAAFDRLRRVSVLVPSQRDQLSRVDARRFEAGMLGVNEAGLYRPAKRV